MNIGIAQALIIKHFSDIKISKIDKVGGGTGNIAYEVNTNLIFRFPKNKENQKRLEHEVAIQKILKKYSSLPFPEFIYLPSDHSFVGYRKVSGSSMLHRNTFKNWESFSKQLGNFLSQLHTVSNKELSVLNLLAVHNSFVSWLKQSRNYFDKTKYLINKQYQSKIEIFFKSKAPKNTKTLVLCHNDLGIEHILITGNKISGIIDWGGTILTDPACDFARIYRDLGEKVLDSVLAEYVTTQFPKKELRERAIFYGKCLLFEDLFYGLGQEIYRQKVFAALAWMF